MRRLLPLFAVLGLCVPALAQAPAPAPVPQKIGYVDLERAFNSYDKTKERNKEIKEQVDKKTAELEAKQKRLQDLQKDLEAGMYAPDSPAFKEKQEEFLKLKVEAQLIQERAMQELQRLNVKWTYELYKDVEAAVKEIGQKEGYTLILAKDGVEPDIKNFQNVAQLLDNLRVRKVIWADGSNDVTDKVIALVNGRWAVDKTKAPAAVPPVAPAPVNPPKKTR